MKKSTEKGFALPTVIFFLVIVASIVGTMSKLASNQAGATSLSIQSVRAYYAAKSGVEWAAHQIENSGSCSNSSLTLTSGLTGFTVAVSCDATNTYVEGGATVTIYEISSTATSGIFSTSPDYVYRRISAVMSTQS